MNTLSNKITAKGVVKILRHYDFKIFTNSRKNFNLNIVNIRSSDIFAGKFDDVQILFWYYNDRLSFVKFDITVDPGVPYLLKPLNKKGAAIVCPGQYDGVWQLGKHKGKYDALVQVESIDVYRDNNKDTCIQYITLDDFIINLDWEDYIDDGLFGINCHRASNVTIAERVGYYSAGCVVHQDHKKYLTFIRLCKNAAMNWGNSFTATWITESDYDKVNKQT